MAAPRPILVRRINWWFYALPIVPILVVGYLALLNLLPSWALLVALFAFFMWLFSLGFALVAVLTRKQPEDPRV